jgi:CTP synthase
MEAIRYAREHNIPYLGICLGMQLAMIEFARNVLHIEDANSAEFNPNCKNPIIYLIDSFMDASGQKQLRTFQSPLGGTMRLGGYECETKENSLLRTVYDGAKVIRERHRHRYEANPAYRESFEKAGLIVSGESDGLIEAVELKGHQWFLGVQFHPEFTSRLTNPNKTILGFAKAALTQRQNG